jgi:uncharacterized protein (TIGR02466 family)
MNENFILTPLFPTSVVSANINRDFSQEEIDFIKLNQKNNSTNEGNNVSEDSYILEKKEFFNLKNEALKVVNFYLNEILIPSSEVSPYITQSWLNFTEPGEYHHMHNHTNSYLSGVIYINADFAHDKIHFYKQNYSQIKLYTREPTLYNSDSWWLPVKTGDILVFPSHLTHSVEKTTSKETRISLAFNTFLKGKIGSEKKMTELLNN